MDGALLAVIVLLNLALLGGRRTADSIGRVAGQGLAASGFALAAHHDALTLRLCLLAGGAAVLKAAVFPALCRRALRHVDAEELDPERGSYGVALIAGMLLLALGFWLGNRLPPPPQGISRLVVPAAFATVFSGLVLMVSRRSALLQVIGYLTMENGIFIFGVAMVPDSPFLVELGILLDVFVAVFVMGLMMFHIGRTFEDIDTDRLAELGDGPKPS